VVVVVVVAVVMVAAAVVRVVSTIFVSERTFLGTDIFYDKFGRYNLIV